MSYWDSSWITKGAKSFMHPEDAYKKAAEQFQNFWDQAQVYQKPYSDAGLAQLSPLTNAENQLLNPTDLLGKWMEKYQISPYAKRSMENAKASGMDAASSMGLEGSSSALNNIQQSSADIMNQDRAGFLKDLMEKFKTGIGVGQDIYDKGAATAGNLGTQALGVGNEMGGAAYGAEGAPGEMFKNLMAMMMKVFGGGAGGGAGASAS